MHLPELRFEFHDSCLCEFSLGPRFELSLRDDLYPVYYPDKPTVLVRFGKIVNFEAIKKFFHQIEANTGDYVCRVDSLAYDRRTKSKSNDLHLFLELDWYGAIKIHCGKLAVDMVERPQNKGDAE